MTKKPPKCPLGHGPMIDRPLKEQNDTHRWCGAWFDCSQCRSSVLIMSDALKAQLAEQEAARIAREAQATLHGFGL